MDEQETTEAESTQAETIPYLRSYPDQKWQRAYEAFLDGSVQREVAATLKIPERTIAWRCSRDAWVAERRARAATDAPSAVAELRKAMDVQSGVAVDTDAPESTEDQAIGQRRTLQRQQRIAGLLVSAYEQEVLDTVTSAQLAGRRLRSNEIRKYQVLGADLFTMERRAWQVPDKIETKDTTQRDPVRVMTEEDLDRRERELSEQLQAAARRVAGDQRGEASPEGVN